MMQSTSRALASVAAVICGTILAGCSNIEASIFGADRANAAAPRQVVDAALDGVDLIGLLVPEANDQAELSRRVRERMGERRSPLSGSISGKASGAIVGGLEGRITTDWIGEVMVIVSGSIPPRGPGQIIGIVQHGTPSNSKVDGHFTALVELTVPIAQPQANTMHRSSAALFALATADAHPVGQGDDLPSIGTGDSPIVGGQRAAEAFVAGEVSGGVIGQFAGIITRKSDGTVEGKLTGALYSEPTRAGAISGVTTEDMRARNELAVAYEIFEANVRKTPSVLGMTSDEFQRKKRNDLQDEILRASEQRCGVYKVYLTRTQTGTSFLAVR